MGSDLDPFAWRLFVVTITAAAAAAFEGSHSFARMDKLLHSWEFQLLLLRNRRKYDECCSNLGCRWF